MQITKFWSSSIKFNKAMLWIYFTIMFYIKFFVNPNCKSKSIVKSPDVVNRLTKYIPKSFNNNSRTSSTLLDMSNNRRHVFKNRNTCTQMYLYKYTESGNGKNLTGHPQASTGAHYSVQVCHLLRVIEQHLHPLSTVNQARNNMAEIKQNSKH